MDEKKRRQWSLFREKMALEEERIKRCGRLCREYWPDECRLAVETADQLLDHTFLFQLPWDMEQTQEPARFSGDIDWKYVLHEDNEFVFQMNRHRFWICLGQAYGLTGHERYAKELVYQLLDWLDKEPWVKDSENLTWRTLDAGLRADYWVRAMALCAYSPSVTEEVGARFLEGLEVHGRRLFENPKTGFSRKSNWGIMEYTGLYVLGLILENPEYVERASGFLREGLRIQVMDDGMQWEGSPMYHNEVLMACLEALRVSVIWGHDLFSRQELGILENMARATMNLMNPRCHQPMTGDSDDTDVRDLLTEAAFLLKSSSLKAGAFENLDYESIWLFGPEGFEAYGKLEAGTNKAGIVNLPCSGQVVARSSWEEDGDWLYFKNGPLGGGHGHQDKLHIGLWLGGEEVLADSGRFTYKDVPERYDLKGAMAHNVPMIRGKEYAGSKDSWTYESLPQCFPNQVVEKAGCLFIEGAHGGYLDQGVVVRRRVVQMGFDIFVINDTFLGNMPSEIAQMFHFGDTVKVFRTEAGVEGEGLRSLFFVSSFADGKAASMELDQAPLSRHYNQMGQTARLCVSGKGVRTLTTFLVRRQGHGAVDIVREPVFNDAYGHELSVQEGEGYVVTAGSRKAGLVFLGQEVGNQSDYNGLLGVYGLGRTMVCDLNQDIPRMTVLQW
ncbi:MAG: heparinase [Hungatella sp.]|nr:heparinase [Hungatella sp.]